MLKIICIFIPVPVDGNFSIDEAISFWTGFKSFIPGIPPVEITES